MKHAEDLSLFRRIHDLFNYVGLGRTIKTECEFAIHYLANFGSDVDNISLLYEANLLPGSIYFNRHEQYKHFFFCGRKDVCLITLSESFLKETVHGDIFEM